MSQASKYVDWCLKKAKQEIEQCKKEGQSPKHRGLLKANPDVKEAKRHLEKAEHDFKVTEYLVEGGFTDTSVGTIFYTMYQCFLSIAAKFSYESGNQTCTIALMEYLKEKGEIEMDEKFFKYFKYEDGETEESVIEMREKYTYGTKKEVDKSKIDFFIERCKELLDITKGIVYE